MWVVRAVTESLIHSNTRLNILDIKVAIIVFVLSPIFRQAVGHLYKTNSERLIDVETVYVETLQMVIIVHLSCISSGPILWDMTERFYLHVLCFTFTLISVTDMTTALTYIAKLDKVLNYTFSPSNDSFMPHKLFSKQQDTSLSFFTR